MICSSMFQLFTALTIKQHFLKDEDVDLILTDSTPAFMQLSKNDKLASIFKNVYFVPNNEKSNKFNRIVKSKYYRRLFELFPKHYLNKIYKNKWCKYTDIYFSSFNTFSLHLQAYLYSKNKSLKTHLFEDGISTYLIRSKYNWRISDATRHLLKIKNFEDRFDDAFFFEPDLICFDYGFPTVTIPKPNTIPQLAEKLDSIFEESSNEITEKFIFFEESFNNDGLITNDAELIDTLWEVLDKKDFILKHHPRNRTDRFRQLLPNINFPLFWEHYIIKHNIDDKIIVTVSSNTSFVPYILNGCKPTIVLLYKIFNGTSPILGSGNFEKYVEQYLKYTGCKVYIPETIEEFKKIILNLRGN